MRKVILGLVGVIFVTSFVYAQLEGPRIRRPAEKAAERGREGVTIPDDPQIREFSVNPTSANIGTRITLRWRVEPGVSNPISSINMASPALGMNVSSGDSSGSHIFSLPARIESGRYQITLAATNEAGRLANRAIEISITRELGLRATQLWASPEEFSEGESVTFFVGTTPNEGEDLEDLMIIITREGREVVRIGPVFLGSGHSLGRSSYGRRPPSVRAYPGTYQVELRSGDQVSRREEFRIEAVPRYRIAP